MGRIVVLERTEKHAITVDLDELSLHVEENAKKWGVDRMEALKRMGYAAYIEILVKEGFKMGE